MRQILRGRVLASLSLSLSLLIVSSLVSCGGGSSTTTSSTTPVVTTSSLSAPTSVAVTRGAIRDDISWKAVTGAVGYNVYAQSPTASRTAKASGVLACTNLANPPCTYTANGVNYIYVVTGVDSNGLETDSSLVATNNPPVFGCTIWWAVNYNPNAIVYSPGSCRTYGCMDGNASNYDPDASINDGSCKYPNNVTQFTVTASTNGGFGGVTYTPNPQTVNSGLTAVFTTTGAQANMGGIGGTCPAGSWNGLVYTTGAITANCTVTFNVVN
jgi:hypothetical protein